MFGCTGYIIKAVTVLSKDCDHDHDQLHGSSSSEPKYQVPTHLHRTAVVCGYIYIHNP